MHLAGLRFLVVDDSPALRRIVRGLLGDIGCPDAHEAADGVQALQLLRQRDHDWVISGMRQPRLDCLALLCAMQAAEGLRPVPVLIVTAGASEDIDRALRQGAAGYIVKPFTATALQNKLRHLLARHANPT